MLNIVSHHVHKAPWFQNFVDLCKHFIIVVVFYFRFAVKHHGIRILCFYFRPVRESGMIRGAVLCEGKKCSEDFAFQFIADIRDATNFYEICVSEEIWDIGAVPCRLAVLEREFQSEVVEICFAAAFCEQFGKFYGRLTHCTVDGKNIYAVLLRICFFESVQNLFGIVSINLFEDFQNLFRCQFVLIISCCRFRLALILGLLILPR